MSPFRMGTKRRRRNDHSTHHRIAPNTNLEELDASPHSTKIASNSPARRLFRIPIGRSESPLSASETQQSISSEGEAWMLEHDTAANGANCEASHSPAGDSSTTSSKRARRSRFLGLSKSMRREGSPLKQEDTLTQLQRLQSARKNLQSDLHLHYFYGSPLALQMYVVMLAAILTRRPVLLHGWTVLILLWMADRTVVWSKYFAHSPDWHKLYRIIHWLTHFWLDQAAKALNGDNLRSYVAVFSYNFWQNRGKDWVADWMRNQRARVNADALVEVEQKLGAMNPSFSKR